MSTTAGAASQEYVAINLAAVATLVLGLASSLVLMSSMLLVIPAAAVVVGLLALRQIYNSNGTQTGRGLASIGLLLAVGIAGFVGYQDYQARQAVEAERSAIEASVASLGKVLIAGDYTKAYALFSERFKEQKKVDATRFAERWKSLGGQDIYGKIIGIGTNGRVELSSGAAANDSRIAVTMMVIKFEKTKQDYRQDIVFRKIDGAWWIDDIPSLFPTADAAAPGPATPGQ